MKYFAIVLLATACAARAADWPQVGGNPQHTNSTPDSPAPPYRIAWVADFSPELIYSAQPVIAAGRLFQTTLNGNLYALDVATGRRLWHFRAGTSMWGSAAVEPMGGGTGRVFVATWDGLVYGLDAATGAQLWQFDAGEPISGSPCLAEGTIFLGTRKGNLLAIGTDGKSQWKQPLSWHIYSTVAWDAGKVFAVTEDMFVHGVDAKTGRPLWKSQKLHGMLFREFYPVAHQGRVFVSVTPSEWRGAIDVPPFIHNPGKELMAQCSSLLDPKQDDKPSAPRRSLIRGKQFPAELEQGQQKLVEFYEQNPHLQTLYVFDAADGKQPYKAVHQYGSAGLQQVIMPPAVCSDGTLVVYCTMGGARLARFDPASNRWVDILFELGGTATDESEFDSVGGLRIFSKNTMRSNSVLDLASGQVTTLALTGATPLQVSAMPAQWAPAAELSPNRLSAPWHGAPVGMSPMPIAGNHVFWMRRTQCLVAYEGVSP